MEALAVLRRGWLLAAGSFCLLGLTPGHALAGSTATYWIAPRVDGIEGKGTQHDPFDGSSTLKFDALMSNAPVGASIHLLEGTFSTRGIVPKSGWRLYLTKKTVLRLDVLENIPGQKWSIVTGAPQPVSNILIQGGVWDCNLQNQKIPLAAQAISFITGEGNVTIKDLKVINWGSTFPNAEAFVVSVFSVGSTGLISRNIVFDGIEVTQPAAVTHHGTGTLVGAHGQDPKNPEALSAGWLSGIEIKNCYIHDIDLPVMTAGVGMGSWCQSVHIHHNHFERLGPRSDTLFGCYLDTGASENVLIEENAFDGVVHSVFANLGSSLPAGKWVIRNNKITINRNNSAGGVELRSRIAQIRDVLIEGNSMRHQNGPITGAVGILLTNVTAATIRNNSLQDLNPGTAILFGRGVSHSAVVNNRDKGGVVLKATSQDFE